LSSKVTILEKPILEEALNVLRHGLSNKRTVLIAGVCTVRYDGRARSILEEGERLLIVKADGNVLIHRPTGLEPVNYMPSTGRQGPYESTNKARQTRGCLFRTRVDGKKLTIKAVQRKTKESLSIVFKDIYILVILGLVDEGRFSLYASEEDMQRAVLAHPRLIEAGFRPITYEKPVPPGFIDVYGVDSQGRLVVVEIKRKPGNRAAVLQLAKYMEVIRGDRDEGVRGVLAAPSIAKGVQKLLATLNLEFKPLDPKQCAELLDRGRREDGLDAYFHSSS
jgi:RecB family endonuclease NucS